MIVRIISNTKPEPLTSPKTHAADIKAFANSRLLRESDFHFANGQ